MVETSAHILRNPGAWIALHWITALLMVALVASGIVAHDMPSGPNKGWTYNLHKSLGIAVLLLTAARLFYRRKLKLHRAPGSHWQHLAASAAHVVLYSLLIAMPVTGYLSAGNGVNLFWLIQIPKALPDDLGDVVGELHVALQYALYAVVALHVLGALAHHYFWRDRTLAVMVPGLKSRAPISSHDAKE